MNAALYLLVLWPTSVNVTVVGNPVSGALSAEPRITGVSTCEARYSGSLSAEPQFVGLSFCEPAFAGRVTVEPEIAGSERIN